MGSFIIGLLIPIIIGIVIIILIIRRSIKKKTPVIKKEEVKHEKKEDPHATKHDDHGHDDHGHDKPKNKSGVLSTIATWLAVISFVILIIVWIVIGIRHLTKDKEPVKKELNHYLKYYYLKNGAEPIFVEIKDGYTTSCSSGGKKYYKKPQNGEWEIRGDGKDHKDRDVSYFYLAFYQEEIVVTVEFNKIE